jgi:hypothetical protein
MEKMLNETKIISKILPVINRRRYVLFLLFLIIFYNTLFAQIEDIDDAYILNSIGNDFIGVYLSIEFLEILNKTKSYAIAMNHNSNYGFENYYEIIVVYENRIKYNYLYYDGYGLISKYDYQNYKFEYINENEIFITDPNEHKYIKITNDLLNYNEIISNIIGNIVLKDLITNEFLTIENNIISIPSLENKKYIIRTLRYLYNRNENLILEDFDNNRLVSLSIENSIYTIFWIERNFYTSYQNVKRIIWVQEYINK